MPDPFQCSLVTPQRKVFEDKVTYASIPGWDGLIGLMNLRAPLMVKLGPGSLRLDYTEGGSRWFFLAGGFAQMKDNQLSLITSEAIAAEDISKEEAELALKEAQADTPHSDEELDRNQQALQRARAMIDLAQKSTG